MSSFGSPTSLFHDIGSRVFFLWFKSQHLR
jgi:hypothetical protein